MIKPSDLLLRRKAGDLSVTDQQIADAAKNMLLLQGSPIQEVLFVPANLKKGRRLNVFRLQFSNGAWATASFSMIL